MKSYDYSLSEMGFQQCSLKKKKKKNECEILVGSGSGVPLSPCTRKQCMAVCWRTKVFGCRSATGKTRPLLFILPAAASQPSYTEIQQKLVILVE